MYVLKEDNKFYGKQGHRISDHVFDKLPKKHQLLFEKNSVLNRPMTKPSVKMDMHNIQDFLNEWVEPAAPRRGGINEVIEDQVPWPAFEPAFGNDEDEDGEEFLEDEEEDYDDEEE